MSKSSTSSVIGKDPVRIIYGDNVEAIEFLKLNCDFISGYKECSYNEFNGI